MTPSSLPLNDAVAGNIVALIDRRKPSLKLQREIEELLDRSYPKRRRKPDVRKPTKQQEKALGKVQLSSKERDVLLAFRNLELAITAIDLSFRSGVGEQLTRLCLKSLIKKDLVKKVVSSGKLRIAYLYPTKLGSAWLAQKVA